MATFSLLGLYMADEDGWPALSLGSEIAENYKYLHHQGQIKISDFSGNFTKNFNFLGKFPKNFNFVSGNFTKNSIFQGKFPKNIDFPGKNWLFTAISGQIILFLFKSHHFRTYFLYMIRL